jgi:predicted amidohydrolase YtcJ
VHDAGSTVSVVSMLQHLARQGTLPLRVYCMVDARKDMPEELRTEPPMPDFAGGMVAVRAVKFSLDGALGSRGAALLEPYSDAPSEKGLLLIEEKAFEEKIRFCHERGYQAAVHCIGDRANRTTLDVFERVLKDEKNPKALRWRIEHAQVTHPSDVPRFAALGLVASMQPTHCTSDMPWAGQRLGWSRLNRAYAWREFLKAGCVLAGGSDFPVESANPFYGIYAAVTRQDASGRPEGGWQPSQRLSRHEALRAFTWGAAYAAFAEERQGFLKPGAFADLVVVDRDPMEVPPLEIRGTKVLLTMTGGKISYRAPEFNLP